MLFKKNEKIVFVGDSITDCERKRPEGEGAPAFNPFGNSYVNLVFGYLHSQYPDLHLRIINQGISGHKSSDVCARYDEILNLNPDWIFLMIGINDVWRFFDCPEIDYLHIDVDEYRKNVEDLITRTLNTKAKMIVLSPFMMETNLDDPMRKKLLAYQEALKEVVDKYTLRYIDIQAAFNRLLQDITYRELSRDRIHPNITGHMLIMKTIMNYVEEHE